MDKEDVIYNEFSISLEKELLPIATICMDLEGIMPSEIRQRKTNIL